MLICAVSDFHGSLAWLVEAIERHSPDLLLCAGDWGDPGQVSRPQVEEILSRVHTLSIYGNHDDRRLLKQLRNRDGSAVLLAQGEARKVGQTLVAGISGIWAKTTLGSRLNSRWQAASRRNPGLTLEQWTQGRELPPYVTNTDIDRLVDGLVRTPIDILVTHGCPGGLGDRTPQGRHGGQRCFRRIFEALAPRIHLCGHVHCLQRDDIPDGRAVLNCGSGAAGDGWLIDWRDRQWTAAPLDGPLLQP